jgi:hypothetical protein
MDVQVTFIQVIDLHVLCRYLADGLFDICSSSRLFFNIETVLAYVQYQGR